MEANEIRLGNLVLAGKMEEPITIFTIGYDIKDGYIINKHIPINHIHPINLSPEILEKCGFENDNGEYEHPDNTDFDLMFCCSPNGYWCGYNYGYQGNGASDAAIPQAMVANPICNPFKYVHQLQNLYFALTGKELNLNL